MKTDQLTFNDLPAVVGELCDRIASMENLHRKCRQKAQGWGRGVIILVGKHRKQSVKKSV